MLQIDPKKFHEVIEAKGLLSLKSDFQEMFVDKKTPYSILIGK